MTKRVIIAQPDDVRRADGDGRYDLRPLSKREKTKRRYQQRRRLARDLRMRAMLQFQPEVEGTVWFGPVKPTVAKGHGSPDPSSLQVQAESSACNTEVAGPGPGVVCVDVPEPGITVVFGDCVPEPGADLVGMSEDHGDSATSTGP